MLNEIVNQIGIRDTEAKCPLCRKMAGAIVGSDAPLDVDASLYGRDFHCVPCDEFFTAYYILDLKRHQDFVDDNHSNYQ